MSSSRYGDPAAVRRRAGALRDQGADLSAMAERLVASADAVAWRGRAADDLRERVGERAANLKILADRHETAAASLIRHADETAERQRQISEIETKAEEHLAQARERVSAAEAEGRDADDQDRQLAALDTPSSGHRDWLDIDIPGLRT